MTEKILGANGWIELPTSSGPRRYTKGDAQKGVSILYEHELPTEVREFFERQRATNGKSTSSGSPASPAPPTTGTGLPVADQGRAAEFKPHEVILISNETDFIQRVELVTLVGYDKDCAGVFKCCYSEIGKFCMGDCPQRNVRPATEVNRARMRQYNALCVEIESLKASASKLFAEIKATEFNEKAKP